MIPDSAWSLGSDNDRDYLVRFWINAPSDQISFLWTSPVGDRTALLIKQLNTQSTFTADQISTRDALGAFFNDHGLKHPLSTQLMLANFLLSPPGLLKVNNVSSFFPQWFVDIYNNCYVESQDVNSSFPANPNNLDVQSPPLPTDSLDFGPFPSSLTDLVNNRLHLNRLLGLANLYYIDPEDREICNELRQIRLDLASLINSADESQLQSIWSTDLGERYWALVKSGIQSEPLSDNENNFKNSSTHSLNPASGGGFDTPGSTNAFLIAMMFYEPSSMKVDDSAQKIPAWLLPHYQQIFESNNT